MPIQSIPSPTLHQQRIFNKAIDDAGYRESRYLAAGLAPPGGLLVCMTRVGISSQAIENALLAAEIWYCDPCARLGVLRYAVEVRDFLADHGEDNVELGLCAECALR